MAKKTRLIIKPQDVSIILELSYKQAYRKYNQVKDALGRLKHQELTFKEFADYFGLNVDDIYRQLG